MRPQRLEDGGAGKEEPRPTSRRRQGLMARERRLPNVDHDARRGRYRGKSVPGVGGGGGKEVGWGGEGGGGGNHRGGDVAAGGSPDAANFKQGNPRRFAHPHASFDFGHAGAFQDRRPGGYSAGAEDFAVTRCGAGV